MKYFVWITLALTFCPAAEVFAQKPGDDGPVGMFSTRQEYDEFMGAAKTAAADQPELRSMIPLINDIALQQPFGSTARQYRTAGSPLGLLSDPRIRADIEMVDDQYKELQSLNAGIQQRLAEQLRAIDFNDSGNVASQLRAMRDAAQRDLNGVLLPHQLARLRQIRMQSKLRRRSFIDLLTNDPLKSELGITDDQTEALKTAEQEIEVEMQKEIARLRNKARDRLLAKLTATQRAKVKEMFGDAFEFRESSQQKSGDKGAGAKDNRE